VRTIDQNQIPQVQVLTPGVQLSGKVRKVQELEHAETTLCLQQFGLAKETVRTLAWIKGGRKPGYRRAPDTLSLPGVQHIDIQVYSRLHVVYPKQSSEHQFVKEMLYCKDEYPMGKTSTGLYLGTTLSWFSTVKAEMMVEQWTADESHVCDVCFGHQSSAGNS